MTRAFHLILQQNIDWLQRKGPGAILARGAGGAFIADALGRVFAFGLQLLLARLMGVEQYGIFAYVLAWLNILVLVAKLGLDTMLVRFVPIYKIEHRWSLLYGVMRCSDWLTLISSLAVAGVTAGVVWRLNTYLDQELVYTFWIACMSLPLTALLSMRQAVLQALKYIVLSRTPEQILRPVMVGLLVVGVVIFFSRPITAPIVMGFYVIAAVLSLLIAMFWLRQRLPGPVQLTTPTYRYREWITTALPLLLVSGIYLFAKRADALMIGALLGTTEAGIYIAASKVTDLTLFGLVATQAIAAPMISELFSQKRLHELQRVVTLTARWALVVALPMTLIVLIWGQDILRFFGPGFVAGYSVMSLLLMGQLINAMTGPVGLMMSMTGHHHQLVLILAISVAVNIVLNYFLIMSLGMVGAALATMLVNIGWNLAATLYVYKRLHINCFALRFVKL